MEKPEFHTVAELAARLRLSERTTYDLVRQGRIPGAVKVGGGAPARKCPSVGHHAFLAFEQA